MSNFEDKFFQKIPFSEDHIRTSFDNALRDLEIAKQDPFIEVRFSYSYQALLKAGISLLAKVGSVRVRSIAGHHIKILEKTAEILGDPDVFTVGNAMRMKRNADLYSGGTPVSEKEAKEYHEFVADALTQISKILD